MGPGNLFEIELHWKHSSWIVLPADMAYVRFQHGEIQADIPGPERGSDTAHVWIAFLLCYIWLRHEKELHTLACVLEPSVFAFSGYMLMQLQHLGLIAGYAWMPLGLPA